MITSNTGYGPKWNTIHALLMHKLKGAPTYSVCMCKWQCEFHERHFHFTFKLRYIWFPSCRNHKCEKIGFFNELHHVTQLVCCELSVVGVELTRVPRGCTFDYLCALPYGAAWILFSIYTSYVPACCIFRFNKLWGIVLWGFLTYLYFRMVQLPHFKGKCFTNIILPVKLWGVCVRFNKKIFPMCGSFAPKWRHLCCQPWRYNMWNIMNTIMVNWMCKLNIIVAKSLSWTPPIKSGLQSELWHVVHCRIKRWQAALRDYPDAKSEGPMETT